MDEERQEEIIKQIGMATSLAELESEQEAVEMTRQVEDSVYKFFAVATNIFSNDMVTDKKQAIKNLTTELSIMIDNLPAIIERKEKSPLTPLVKLKNKMWDGVDTTNDVFIFKGFNGKSYLYGRPTNFFKDREGDILKGTAHIDFVKKLDNGEVEPPELWVWHEAETAFKNKAIWWDYADGKLHLIWPLTEDETEKTKKFLSLRDAGMSHGFNGKRDEKNNNIFTSYVMKEASILPKEFAANTLADFDLLEEEEKMAFSDTKREDLSIFASEELIDAMEKKSEKQLKQAELLGIEYVKQKEEKMKKNEDSQEVIAVESTDANEDNVADVDTTEDNIENEPITMEDLQVFADSLMANFNSRFEAMEKQINQNVEQKQRNISKAQRIAEMLQYSKQSSILASEPVTDDDVLLKRSPQENNGGKPKNTFGLFGREAFRK